MISTKDYRLAPSGEGPHAANWKDKPHRVVYDLCAEVERLKALAKNGALDWVNLLSVPPAGQTLTITLVPSQIETLKLIAATLDNG